MTDPITACSNPAFCICAFEKMSIRGTYKTTSPSIFQPKYSTEPTASSSTPACVPIAPAFTQLNRIRRTVAIATDTLSRITSSPKNQWLK